MKIQLKKLLECEPELAEIVQTNLKVKKAVDVAIFIRKVEEYLKPYHENKMNRFKEWGEEIDGQLVIKEEFRQQYLNEINETIEQEIELPDCKISIDDFRDDAELKPQIVAKLDWLIVNGG